MHINPEYQINITHNYIIRMNSNKSWILPNNNLTKDQNYFNFMGLKLYILLPLHTKDSNNTKQFQVATKFWIENHYNVISFKLSLWFK